MVWSCAGCHGGVAQPASRDSSVVVIRGLQLALLLRPDRPSRSCGLLSLTTYSTSYLPFACAIGLVQLTGRGLGWAKTADTGSGYTMIIARSSDSEAHDGKLKRWVARRSSWRPSYFVHRADVHFPRCQGESGSSNPASCSCVDG